MAATYRRVNMKALARYQIILLGEQLAQGRCPTVQRPGVETATSRSRVRHANHYTTKLRSAITATAELLVLATTSAIIVT